MTKKNIALSGGGTRRLAALDDREVPPVPAVGPELAAAIVRPPANEPAFGGPVQVSDAEAWATAKRMDPTVGTIGGMPLYLDPAAGPNDHPVVVSHEAKGERWQERITVKVSREVYAAMRERQYRERVPYGDQIEAAMRRWFGMGPQP